MTRRTAFLLAALLLASCGERTLRRGQDDGTLHRYRMEGVVVSRDDAAHTVTIKHGQIADDAGKVWMEPMTMEFPLLNDADAKTLEPGTAMKAMVVSRASDLDYWLDEVRVTGSPKPDKPAE
ncbi:MAG: copper-binding protein [Bryobacteraceae bacterium]